MNKSNEANGINIQDLEQWFDEELELYGNESALLDQFCQLFENAKVAKIQAENYEK